MSYERRTPQEYEVLTGGGAESAEVGRRAISRRQMLRRSVGATLGIVGLEAVAGTLAMLYPNLAGQFGSVITLQAKEKYPAAEHKQVALDSKGLFYESSAKSYIMHLTGAGTTQFLLNGTNLQNTLDSQNWVKDDDGTYWLALYQTCVHLGCKVPYRDDCYSFKCPCHGSHYNVDGEYLDGPAPRSLDRFELTFNGGNVEVNTGKLNSHIQRPGEGTRLLQVPGVVCGA